MRPSRLEVPAGPITALVAVLALGAALAPPPGAAAMGAAPAPAAPAVAAGGGRSAAPGPPSPAPSPSAAAPAPDHRRENKALVRRYLTEVLGAGNLDRLDEIVAGNFLDRSPSAAGNLRGPDAARQAQRRLRELFSKVEYSPQTLIAEGDQVAARYVVLATPRPERGAPPPPPLLLNGIALFQVRAGRIQEVFVLNDQVGLLRQLGYTLVPPGGSVAAPGAAAPAPAAPPPASPGPPPALRQEP